MAGASKSAVVQVILSAKDQSLVETMVKAELATQRLGDKAKEQQGYIKKLGDSFDMLTSSVKAFVGYEVISRAIEKLSEMQKAAREYVREGIDFNDQMERQARNLGISTDAMAAFTAMESQADLESGSLASSLAKMQESIQAATVMGSSADKTFKDLGIRFSSLIGLSADEQFKIIAEAISKVDDASARTAISMDIFGKNGKNLVGVLGDGKKAFEDAAEAAKNLGLILDAGDRAALGVLDKMRKENELLKKALQEKVAAATAAEEAISLAVEREELKREAKTHETVMATASWYQKAWAATFDALDAYARSEQGSPIGPGDEAYMQRTKALESAAKQVNSAIQEAKKSTDSASESTKQWAGFYDEVGKAQKENAAEEKRRADAAKDFQPTLLAMQKATLDIEKEHNKELAKAGRIYYELGDVIDKYVSDMKKIDAENKRQASSGYDFTRGDYKVNLKAMEEAGNKERTFKAMQMEEERGIAMNQIQQEKVRYAQRLSAIQNQLSKEKITKDQARQLEEEAAEAHAERTTKALELEMQAKAHEIAGFFGNISTLAGAFAEQSKAMFVIGKLAAIAQAEVNAWLAYSQVHASPTTFDPATKEAMAGIALAAGQVAVMNIAKQQPPGRANGGPVTGGQMYEVGERGPEMFIQDGKQFMIPGRDGYVNSGAPGGGPASITINVINNGQPVSAQVQQSGTPSAPRIDVILDAVAGDIRGGRGSVARAVEGTYGLNRRAGAR